MVTRAEVIAEFRSWVDTPIYHRGRSRKGGVDCLGLMLGAGVACGALDDPCAGGVEPWGKYGRIPNPVVLVGFCDTLLLPCHTPRPGDVIALSWGDRDAPMHLALLAAFEGRRTIIHAMPRTKPPRVLEMTYGADWPDRFCGAWSFPKVTD